MTKNISMTLLYWSTRNSSIPSERDIVTNFKFHFKENFAQIPINSQRHMKVLREFEYRYSINSNIKQLTPMSCSWYQEHLGISIATLVCDIYFWDGIDTSSLQWSHNERDGVSNHRRLDGLRNRLFRRYNKQISKLRVIGLCEGNSPVAGEFPSQRASNAENLTSSIDFITSYVIDLQM